MNKWKDKNKENNKKFKKETKQQIIEQRKVRIAGIGMK